MPGQDSTTAPQKRTATEIRRLIRAQRRSGLSVKAYCDKHSLSAWTFYEWRKRYVKATGQVNTKSSVRFTEVRGSVGATSRFELVFAQGTCLRIPAGFSRDELSWLVELLSARGPC